MKRMYTFEQIVFALRKEYLEVENQLNEMKKHTTITGKIVDASFNLIEPGKISLSLIEKQTILNQIKKHLGLYIFGSDTYNFDVTKDILPSYSIGSKDTCYISNLKELRKRIDDIIQSDFGQNIIINKNIIIPSNEDKNNSLFIAAPGIELMIESGYPYIYYNPSEDVFVIIKKDKIISLSEIYNLFNLNFDGDYLNNYLCKSIDNYEEKELIIEDNFDSQKAKLQIIEEPKKLILKPKQLKY